MKITSVKTRKIAYPGNDLFKILDQYLPPVKEKMIVAITSKIVSICEGRVVEVGKIDKDKLIEKEADFIFSSRKKNKYGIALTIKNNLLIPTAGIDESNGNGYYIGKKDVFGKRLNVTKANIYDSLAAAAVLAMGEGKEQTPLAIIEDIDFVKFKKRNPTAKELKELKISINDDLYSPLLKSVDWRKRKKF